MENKRDRHFTEEEIKDKIVQSAEGMEVPDSLKPENIEKKLAQKKKKRTPVYGIVAAAACCCLVVGAVALSGRGMMQDKEAQKAAEKAADDTVAESTAALASAKDYDQIYKYVQAAAEEEEIMYGTGELMERLFIQGRKQSLIRLYHIPIRMCGQRVSVKVMASRRTESICIS